MCQVLPKRLFRYLKEISVTDDRILPVSWEGISPTAIVGGYVWWYVHWIRETFTEAHCLSRKDVSHELLNLLRKICPPSPQTDKLDWDCGNKWLAFMVLIETEIFFSSLCFSLNWHHLRFCFGLYWYERFKLKEDFEDDKRTVAFLCNRTCRKHV